MNIISYHRGWKASIDLSTQKLFVSRDDDWQEIYLLDNKSDQIARSMVSVGADFEWSVIIAKTARAAVEAYLLLNCSV